MTGRQNRGIVFSMKEHKFVAIVAHGEPERQTLNRLFVSEGFPVEAYSGVRDFEQAGDLSDFGCLIIDLDAARGEAGEQALTQFATEWSRKLPVIVVATDEKRLPLDPFLPTLSKDAGETRLLYLVYGAIGEPGSQGILRCSPQWIRRA
jgi:hypothetical protein